MSADRRRIARACRLDEQVSRGLRRVRSNAHTGLQRAGVGLTLNFWRCTDRFGDDIVGGDPHFCFVATAAMIHRLPLLDAADVNEEFELETTA